MATLVTIHSIWRWVLLLAAALAFVGAAAARGGGGQTLAMRTGRFFTLAIDVQVLTGLILWLGTGAWASSAFFAFIHPLTMLLATAVAHIGYRRWQQAGGTAGARVPWLYLVSLGLLILGIPTYAWRL